MGSAAIVQAQPKQGNREPMIRHLCVATLFMGASIGACDKVDSATDSEEATSERAAASTASSTQSSAKKRPKVVPGPPDAPISESPLVAAAKKRWNAAVKAASADDTATLRALVTPQSRHLFSKGGGWAKAFFVGTISKPVEVNGGLIALELDGPRAGSHIVAFYRDGDVLLDPAVSRRYRVSARRVDHPDNKSLSLAEATVGVKGVGKLRMTLKTTRGDINCEFHEERAPLAVATFVGLARGLRSFKLPTDENWTKRPFYTGLAFHKVLAGKMIASGSPTNDGKGGPGFSFRDEFDLDLRHDGPGVLGLVNEGPQTNGSQFYITAGRMPEYDDKHTVFGRCSDVGLVKVISQAKTKGHATPESPVSIHNVEFFRKP